MYLLDTSAAIALISNGRFADRVEKVIENGDFCLSTFVSWELLKGAKDKDFFYLLGFVRAIFNEPFDLDVAEVASEVYIEQKRKGSMLCLVDFLIAATCIAKGHTLITLDSDFKKIKGLSLVHISK
jgi:predicted nucleic acid-binding protein